MISCYSPKSSKLGTTINTLEDSADKYYTDKQYIGAIKLYDTLIIIDPNKDIYYFRRGVCKTHTEDYIGAKNDYLKTISLKSENEKRAYLNMGTLYRFFGIYDSAMYFYDQSLKLDSNYLKGKLERDELKSLLKKLKTQK